MIHSLWQISLRNIKTNKATMLTAFISVTLSVALITLIITFTHQAQNALIEDVRQRTGGIDAIISGEITPKHVEAIGQIAGVSDVLPIHQQNLDVQLEHDSDRQLNVYAIGTESSAIAQNRYEFSTFFSKEQVIISATISEFLNVDIGDDLYIEGENFEIVEIIGTEIESNFHEFSIVIIPFDDFSQIIDTSNANYLAIAFDNPQMGSQLLPSIRQIDENLAVSSISEDIRELEDFSTLQIFVYIFAAIVIFSCSFMVVSNFQTFIENYRGQFSIMRSFGTSGGQLSKILFIQGVIIVGSGTVVGIILASLLHLFIFPLLTNIFSLTMTITLNISMLIVTACIFSIIVVASLFIPANQCRRLLPVEITQNVDNHLVQKKWHLILGLVFIVLSLAVILSSVFENESSENNGLIMMSILFYIPGFLLLFPYFLKFALTYIQSKLRKIMKGISDIAISNMINNLKTTKNIIFSIAFIFLISTFGSFMIQTINNNAIRHIENDLFLDITITDILNLQSQLDLRFIEDLSQVESINHAVVLSEREFFLLRSEAGDKNYSFAYLSLDALANLGEINIDIEQLDDMVLITREFADTYNLNVGDSLTLGHNPDLEFKSMADLPITKHFTFRVGGIIEQFPFAPLTDVYIDWNNSHIQPEDFIFNRAFLQTENVNNVIDELSELRYNYPEIRWTTLEDQIALNEQMFLERYGMFIVVLFLVLVSLSLGVINTLFSGMNRRRKEYAVLRAIGTPRKQLAQTVYLQVIIYMLLGMLTGFIHGALLTVIIVQADGAIMSIDYILPLVTFIMLSIFLIPTVWKRTKKILYKNLLEEM